MKRILALHAPLVSVAILAALFVAGCGGPTQLMPTPGLYARGDAKLFEDVPPAYQNNRVEVFYITDRVPRTPDDAAEKAKGALYGTKRSRSAAYGISEVRFGDDTVTWDQLVKASEAKYCQMSWMAGER